MSTRRRMMQCLRNKTILLLVAFFALAAGRLTAQNGTASIVGHVKDPAGAAVAGADVAVTNLDTHDVRTLQTNEAGDYTVPVLKPGHYQVDVAGKGFKSERRSSIVLDVDQTVRIETALTVGSSSESVTVNATALSLDTDNAGVGELIGAEQVSELPLNGRNFQDLLFLSAGAVNNAGGDVTQYRLNTSSSIGNISVGGSRGSSNGYTVDGSSIFDVGYGSPMFSPSLDDIAEFDLLSKSYSAAYGYSMNQINITSKSGTNNYHGSVFEFLRNNSVDALSHGLNYGVAPGTPLLVNLLQQNQFGYSLGGPVRIPWLYNGRNKTFFFANYEGYRKNIGGGGTTTLPSADELSGKFDASVLGTFTAGQIGTGGALTQCGHTYHVGDAHPLFSPFAVPSLGIAAGCPFPVAADGSYTIPSGSISYLGALLLRPGLYFPANPKYLDVALGQPNYSYSAATQLRYDQQNYRIDQNIGSKDSIFFHAVIHNESQNGSSYSPLDADFYTQPARLYTATETHIFSANLTNQIRLGYGEEYWENGPDATISSNDVDSLHWPAPFKSPGEGYPRIEYDVSGLNDGLTYGANQSYFGGTSSRDDSVWDIGESAIWSIKRHTLSFGFDGRRNIYAMKSGGNLGALSFNGEYSGDNFADSLLGASPAIAITELGPTSNAATGAQAHIHLRWFAPYMQDDWKVSDKLTLNLGLRYEFIATPFEEQNSFIWPDFNAPGGALYNANAKIAAAFGGVNPFSPGTGLYVPSPGGERGPGPSPKDNWAPRLGFAYRIFGNDKTVLRGGFGKYFDTIEADEYQASSVNNYPTTGGVNSGPNAGPSYPPAFNTNALPANSSVPALVSNTVAGSSLGFIQIQSDHTLNPYLLAWTLGVERELPWGNKLEIDYVANHGTHLFSRSNPNAPSQCIAINGCTATTTSFTVPIASRVPYQNLGTLVYAGFDGISNYNALDIKVEHRTHNLALIASYTWSKALDDKSSVAGLDGDDAGWAGPQDGHNIAADYGRSDYDDRQRLAISAVYPLPVGRGKVLLGNSSRLVDEVVGGWTVDIISSFQEGLPFTIQAPDPSGSNNSYSARANVNPTPAGFHKSLAKWYSFDATPGSTDATFTQPLPGYYGTSARNAVGAPGAINNDLSLSKRFAVTEKTGFEFKFDAFNAFNHWNPGPPDPSIDDNPSLVAKTFTYQSQGCATNTATPGCNTQRELQISGRFTF